MTTFEAEEVNQPPPTFSAEQIRRVDELAIRDWGIPGAVLMENAGRGVADVMCEVGIESRVVIACAKGNNGGDGFVIARHLHLRGFEVDVLLCCDPADLPGDARLMYGFLQRCDVPIHTCLLYTSPSPRDQRGSRMPSSA